MTEVTITGFGKCVDEIMHAVPTVEHIAPDGAKSHSLNHVALCGLDCTRRNVWRPFLKACSVKGATYCLACYEIAVQLAVDKACNGGKR